MNHNGKKHLTLDDRLEIQQALKEGKNFAQIAAMVGKNRTTITREIRAHRYEVAAGNDCLHRHECPIPGECRKRGIACPNQNRFCRTRCQQCRTGCLRYVQEACQRREKPPYVCSACPGRVKCWLIKMEYDAKTAQAAYETERTEARRGISLSEEELEYLNTVMSKPIKQGQSISVVWQRHKEEMPVSARTVYNYVEGNLLEARNLDLRRKVRMPQRKKSGPILRVDKLCHLGRTFEDYRSYRQENPEETLCQMDTVEGKKGGKVLLTLHLLNCDLQLMYLRHRNTAASVSEIFHRLRQMLGREKFMELFQVVLTDRGTEFTDPLRIEVDSDTGEVQCRLFYCDPQQTNQKSNAERNHGLIRYIIPKGASMDHLTQADIAKVMNHINSYGRAKWNGQSPLDLFGKIYGQEVCDLLGLTKVPPESILLKPELLK